MEPKALTEYKRPNYPLKEEVQAQPSLLRKSVYKRWQKLFDLGVSGMLVASLSLSGCDDKPAANTTPVQNGEASTIENSGSSQARTVRSAEITALVAPVFEHGEGRGATGCVVVSPPVFLSEDEALVVIKEELAKHGIELNKEKVVLNNVTITPEIPEIMAQLGIEKEKPQPLELDLQDTQKAINIEYVSDDDYSKLGQRSFSTVQSYDTRNLAIEIRKEIQNNIKTGIYGIFYDPMVSSLTLFNNTDELERNVKKALESEQETLRQQVKDFAEWLKEQGVI